MSFAPTEHISGYRLVGDSIVFTVNGSTSSGLAAVSIGSRGTYASAPQVVLSGGGGSGATAKAEMGIKTISVSPQPASGEITIQSDNGTGAVLASSYGGPDLSSASAINFICPPLVAPGFGFPSISISGGAGSGAAYQLKVTEMGAVVVSQGGLYNHPPPSHSNNFGAGYEPLFFYGFGAASISAPALFSVTDEAEGDCAPGVAPKPQATTDFGSGSAFAANNTLYKPRTWRVPQLSYWDWFSAESGTIIWHHGDQATLPQFGISASTTGSNPGTITGRYQIYDASPNVNTPPPNPGFPFFLSNAGSGYANVTTFTITGGGSPIVLDGVIQPNGSGGLDISTLELSQASQGHIAETGANWLGWFSSWPTITIDHASGGGTGAVLELHSMRLVRLEANPSSYTYTAQDLAVLATPNRIAITAGVLRDINGQAVNGSNIRLQLAEHPTSIGISNEGSGYSPQETLYWDRDLWRTLTSSGSTTNPGAIEAASAPGISMGKRLKSISIYPWVSELQFTTVSNQPNITLANVDSGSQPTFYLKCIGEIVVTSRGSGYTTPITVTASNIYSNTSLTNAISGSQLTQSSPYLVGISVATRGTGYVAGDTVSVGSLAFPISEVEISTISVLNTGGGYSSPPSVSFSGGGQTVAATATASIGAPTAQLASMPDLTLAKINPTTGDARQIALSLATLFNNIFAVGGLSNRVQTDFRVGFDPVTLNRTFEFFFDFSVALQNSYTLKDE